MQLKDNKKLVEWKAIRAQGDITVIDPTKEIFKIVKDKEADDNNDNYNKEDVKAIIVPLEPNNYSIPTWGAALIGSNCANSIRQIEPQVVWFGAFD